MSEHEQNAIFSAIMADSPCMLTDALESGVDLTITNADGLTPLMLAVVMKSPEFVKRLVNKGADVEHTFQGFTPLMVAAQDGITQVAEVLINENANINAKNPDGLSVLMAAARDGHVQIVKLLLAKRVDIYDTTTHDSTALDAARHFGQDEVVELLEKHLAILEHRMQELTNNMLVLRIDDPKK